MHRHSLINAIQIGSYNNYYYYYKWGLIGVHTKYHVHLKDSKKIRVILDKNLVVGRPTINLIGPLHECNICKKVCP